MKSLHHVLKSSIFSLIFTALSLFVLGCNSPSSSTDNAIVGSNSSDSNTKIEQASDIIALKGATTIILSQGEPYTELGAITDTNFEISGGVDTNTTGTYLITYTTTDSKNNQHYKIRTVIVKRPVKVDSSIPVITLNGDATIVLIKDTSYEELGAFAIDDKDNNLEVVPNGNINTNKVGIYTRIYTVTDSDNNNSAKTRTIIVVLSSDSLPPNLTLRGETPFTHPQNDDYIEHGAYVPNDASAVIKKTGEVDQNTVGSYIITYTTTDRVNKSSTITRIVNVVDQTSPIIELIGEAIITHQQGSEYTDLGTNATDNNDSTVDVTTKGFVDSNKVGNYEMIFTATDKAGNKATQKTRMVIIVDKTPPIIKLLGATTITHKQGDEYADLGAEATDNNDIMIDVIAKGSIDANKLGTYDIIYTAKDKAGNKATEKIRTITVVDKTLPIIELIGEATINHKQGDEYIDLGAKATDNNETVEVTTKGSVDTNTLGTYEITYTAKDKSGNNSIEKTRVVIVVDQTSPIFELKDSIEIRENQLNVITLSATDSNTIHYSLSGADSVYFHLDTVTGEIVFKTAPKRDVKNKYRLIATASDGENKTNQKLIINILKEIIATDDQYTLTNHDALLDVLENDSTDLMLHHIVTAPSHGTASIENNKIRYIANANYVGSDFFDYEAKDTKSSLTITATVQLTVLAIMQQKLNDTGITHCADGNSNTLDCPATDYSGQDADHGANTMSFTKIANGNCVKDNVTGLIWEVKQLDGLHNKNDQYTWYQPDNSKNGGDAGNIGRENTCYGYEEGDPNTYCNTDAYSRRVNAENWCSYTDWRLPTLEELRSIVDYSRANPSIDKGYFENSQSNYYWSSSPSFYSTHAWIISFGRGENNIDNKSYNSPIRLVRSGE
jgi:hypothetical protein